MKNGINYADMNEATSEICEKFELTRGIFIESKLNCADLLAVVGSYQRCICKYQH